MVKSKTRYQDIAKKFETAAKGKKTEKQLLRLQNSLQMVPQFQDWTKTFQDLLLSTYQYDHPWKWDNHRAYFFLYSRTIICLDFNYFLYIAICLIFVWYFLHTLQEYFVYGKRH